MFPPHYQPIRQLHLEFVICRILRPNKAFTRSRALEVCGVLPSFRSIISSSTHFSFGNFCPLDNCFSWFAFDQQVNCIPPPLLLLFEELSPTNEVSNGLQLFQKDSHLTASSKHGLHLVALPEASINLTGRGSLLVLGQLYYLWNKGIAGWREWNGRALGYGSPHLSLKSWVGSKGDINEFGRKNWEDACA